MDTLFFFSRYSNISSELTIFNASPANKLFNLNLVKNNNITYSNLRSHADAPFVIPLLFFRKIMMNLSKQNNEEIIKKGMDTQSKTVTFVINMLKYIELKFLRISILGSSLISIVKK